MEKIFHKIEELTNEFKQLQPLSIENKQRLDKKFRLEFNFNSNHLEGNTLTYGETELLLMFDDTMGNHTMREYEEMKAHDVAYKIIEEYAKEKERPLTEQNIKYLNEKILVRPFWKDAITQDGQNTRREIKIGSYKEFPNSVRLQNGEMFNYASPIDTPIKMAELIEWYRKVEHELHPIILAAELHYRFVCIHPFDDGNGRISRLLVNYVMLKNNLPPIIIKSKDKINYLRALNQADVGSGEDKLNPFIIYIANQLIWSLEISIKAAKGENIEEEDDFDKEISLLSKQSKRLGNEEIKVKRSPEIVKETVNNTIQKLLENFDLKSKKVSTFFHESDFYFNINNSDVNYNAIADIEVHFLYEIAKNEKFNNIRFVYHFKGFKDGGLNPFDEGIYFLVKFNEWNFSICYPKNNEEIEKKYLYDQIISDTEISDISKDISNELLAKIKRNIKEIKD